MNHLSIGKVARSAGVGVETIRFYEKQGLIADPPRRASGYRQYSRDTVVRIRFIKRAKELGFSLNEIKDLLSLRLDPAATCDDVRKRAETKIAHIKDKIRALQSMQKALEALTSACAGTGSSTECPILAALDAEEEFPC